MLTSKVRQRLELPHEPGEWIEVRALSAQHLAEARERKAELNQAAGRRWLEMGVLRQEIQKSEPPAEPEEPTETEPAPEPDPLIWLDAFTMLKYGILKWSYDAQVNVGTNADLDEETVDYVARQLVPRKRDEPDELKNVSKPSTPPSKGTDQPPTTG